MYFQTGQVILSQNGQKGSLLVCDWPHSVRTKSLVCKDALHRDSTIQKYFRDSALVTSQKNWFPVSRLDDRAIPSGRPSVHCSIRLDDDVCFNEYSQAYESFAI